MDQSVWFADDGGTCREEVACETVAVFGAVGEGTSLLLLTMGLRLTIAGDAEVVETGLGSGLGDMVGVRFEEIDILAILGLISDNFFGGSWAVLFCE